MPRRRHDNKCKAESKETIRCFTPRWNIPTRRIKLIPNARPKRARNIDSKSSISRKKIFFNNTDPCQETARVEIFPELTEQDDNYDEIQNQQLTRIPVAQPQLQETKCANSNNANPFRGRTIGQPVLENAGKYRNSTIKRKTLPLKSPAQPKQNDVENMNSDRINMISNASKPRFHEHTRQETTTPLKGKRRHPMPLRSRNSMGPRA